MFPPLKKSEPVVIYGLVRKIDYTRNSLICNFVPLYANRGEVSRGLKEQG